MLMQVCSIKSNFGREKLTNREQMMMIGRRVKNLMSEQPMLLKAYGLTRSEQWGEMESEYISWIINGLMERLVTVMKQRDLSEMERRRLA